LDYIVACVNGALQEVWEFAPGGGGVDAPSISVEDVGTTTDPGKAFPLPGGWEESVLLPLALQRMVTHPKFEPTTAKAEITRQAGVARRLLQRVSPQRDAVMLSPVFC
jgi:hypothetical protein